MAKAKLSERERLFVVAFRGSARGNATKAAIAAGYGKSGAHVQAHRLLRNVKVQRALVEQLERSQKYGEIADAAKVDQVVTSILLDVLEESAVRLKAANELNKVTGRHSMTHHLKGKLTLAQAIMESRRPDDGKTEAVGRAHGQGDGGHADPDHTGRVPRRAAGKRR